MYVFTTASHVVSTNMYSMTFNFCSDIEEDGTSASVEIENPTSFQLDSIASHAPEAKICDTCNERETSVTCQSCDIDYCNECDSKFHRLGKNKDHVRGPKGTKQRTRCEIHDEPLKYFCKTDECLVCVDCIQFGTHKGHEHDLLKNSASIRREEIANLSRVLHEFLATLSILSNKVKDTVEESSFVARRAEASLETNDFSFCNSYREVKESLQATIHQTEMVANHPAIGGNAKPVRFKIRVLLQLLQ